MDQPLDFTDAATNQIIIKYKAGAIPGGAAASSNARMQALSSAAGVTLEYVRAMSEDAHVLSLTDRLPPQAVENIARSLEAIPDVEFAEPDAILYAALTPNDLYYASQWHYLETYGINAPAAWSITTGSNSIRIAVIDTGITDHEDLDGRWVGGYDFINDALVGNDGDSRDADPHDPGDWITANESASGYFAGCPVTNSSWHGTHVSGIIGAASNNGTGVSGVNWVSPMVPVRVLGKCGGYLSDIADGMLWAAGLSVAGAPANPNPAQVMNLSLTGSGTCSSTFQSAIDAVNAAGSIVVVASGNNNADASGFQPANCNGVITVGATDRGGDRAFYSNYGAVVEIAAPGGETSPTQDGIRSTLNTGLQAPGLATYEYYQGTSMAAPQVSGVVSLMLSLDPTLTLAQVTQILQNTAHPFPLASGCNSSNCGGGIVDAAGALNAVLGAPPTATSTPTATLPAGTTLTLQPDGAAGVDTYLLSSSATSNYGTAGELGVGENNDKASKFARSLIRFDLSSVPAGATITSAKLSLWTAADLSNNNRTLRVYRLKVPFNETQATWNSRSSGVAWQMAGASGANDRESTDIGSAQVLASEALGVEKQIMLSAVKIQEMVNGTFANNGFLLAMDTELDDRFNYRSSDSSLASSRPKLVIEYTLGGGSTPVPPAPTATSTATPLPTATRTPTNTLPPPPPSATPTATSLPAATNTATATLPPPPASATPTPTSAASDLIFADEFESGTLSAWSGSVIDGGDLSVNASAAYLNSRGMQALIDDTLIIHAFDDRPADEKHYRARFYFHPHSLAMTSGDTFIIFDAEDRLPTVTRIFGLQFNYNGGYFVRPRVKNDAGSYSYGSYTSLTNTWHAIEIEWQAASASGANNGFMKLWIDGTLATTISAIDSDTRGVDRVYLGAVDSIDAGTSGSIFFDAFESRRSSYIGP